jgi:hypothetical protein
MYDDSQDYDPLTGERIRKPNAVPVGMGLTQADLQPRSPDAQGQVGMGLTQNDLGIQPRHSAATSEVKLPTPPVFRQPQRTSFGALAARARPNSLVGLLGQHANDQYDQDVQYNVQAQRNYENALQQYNADQAARNRKDNSLVPIDTIDDNGKPVRKFITPEAGASYPKPPPQMRPTLKRNKDGKLVIVTGDETIETGESAPDPRPAALQEQAWEARKKEITSKGRLPTSKDFTQFNAEWVGSGAQAKQDAKPDTVTHPRWQIVEVEGPDGKKRPMRINTAAENPTLEEVPGATNIKRIGTEKEVKPKTDPYKAAVDKGMSSAISQGNLTPGKKKKILDSAATAYPIQVPEAGPSNGPRRSDAAALAATNRGPAAGGPPAPAAPRPDAVDEETFKAKFRVARGGKDPSPEELSRARAQGYIN